MCRDEEGAHSPDRHTAMENALRPFPTLGYDRDMLALHLMERGALGIAESQFRRAVWLNPYEPRFAVHLALCLHRQKKDAEAFEILEQLPPGQKTGEAAELLKILNAETGREPFWKDPSNGQDCV